MYTVDESPAHVVATPAAEAHLRTLADARGDVTVLLTEQGAAILKAGQQPPAGTIHLGRLGAAGEITCVADDSVTRAWWRTRAHLDLSDGFEMTYDLSNLSERELFEVLAAGPMPRY
ncbi:MAG: hypothetical protein MUF09_06995 [Candidatus Nanopelagicales bacterium]|nr:hypothetical protein [Candidatus Nanopelagicales bacterium]